MPEKPAWRKVPEALAARFQEVVPPDPRVERRKMFGCPCAFAGGNMFMGTHQENIVLRLSDADRAEFLRIDGASIFEPMAGRQMREYVVAPPAMIDDPAALASWAFRALDHAVSLPAKGRGSCARR